MQECIDEMVSEGHDQDSAGAICQSIKQRAEKGELLKAEPTGLDIISKSDELVVGGYSTWELMDPQGDIVTTKAQVHFLQRYFQQDPEFRQITVKHGDFKLATPLLKYTSPSGKTYYSHVNEKGTYLISKIRNDNFKTTQTWREAIIKGQLNMYSISGLPLEWRDIKEGGLTGREIYDLEPWGVTFCEIGVNPRAVNEVISKSQVPKAIRVDVLDKLQKMTFQECVAEASKDPDVEDPEALCGWLAYHGPNAPMARKATESAVKSDIEEILQKHGFNKMQK